MSVLKFAVLAFVLIVSVQAQGNETLRKFPPNFKFGVATASYQIEGAWDADDKGESIWDWISHNRQDLISDNSTGDVTCDSYRLYKRDIEMLKELGVDQYRFSISWTRILPSGFDNKVSIAGVTYYNNLINELLANNITPFVTIYHWDLPQSLQFLGGWTNPMVVDWFAAYSRVLFETFGDRVIDWLTFNEPKEICLSGYGGVDKAPALNLPGIAEYQCAHNLLKAHAKVYHMYDKEFRPQQKGRISLTISANWEEQENDAAENVAAAERIRQFQVGWYCHPIFSNEGDYPAVMKETVALRSKEQGYSSSRLPVFTQEEVEYIRGTYDFFGLNHYTTWMAREPKSVPNNPIPSFADDHRVEQFPKDEWDTAASWWLKVVPWGFTKLLNWIKANYNNPEVIIFENGYSSRDGSLNDQVRVKYYRDYLNALLDAVDDGCNISGYIAWTLMDNLEWLQGYTERFGLYSVDFNDPDRKRTPKESAFYYASIVKTKEIARD